MSTYLCFESPVVIEEKLLQDPYNLSKKQYTDFISIWAFPNMILPLFGGIIIDKIGLRISIVFFLSLISIGQFIFMLGSY